MAVEADKSASPTDDNTKTVDAAAAAPAEKVEDRKDASSTSEDRKPDGKAEDVKGIDIVRQVLNVDADNQPLDKEVSSPSPSEKKDQAEPSDADKAKVTPDDKKGADKAGAEDVLVQADKSKFRDDPVFKKVTGELRETRTRLETIEATVAKQEPLVKFATEFRQTLEESGINGTQMAAMIELGSLMLKDPHKAREEIAAVLADLDTQLGFTLSPELKKKVDDGDLSLEDAKRISTADAKAKLADTRLRATETRTEQDKKIEEGNKKRQAVQRAVDARLGVLAGADPDFKKKEDQLVREIHYLIAQLPKDKPLQTVDDAIRLVNTAKENVDKFFKDLVPAPKDVRPARGGSEASHDRKTTADLPPTASGLDVTRAALGM